MDTIELVIKIDENTYNDIKNGKIYSSVRDVPQESVNAIANGIPLEKGHGKIVDVSKLHRRIEHNLDGTIFSYVPYIDIDTAPTIIEADTRKDN